MLLLTKYIMDLGFIRNYLPYDKRRTGAAVENEHFVSGRPEINSFIVAHGSEKNSIDNCERVMDIFLNTYTMYA